MSSHRGAEGIHGSSDRAAGLPVEPILPPVCLPSSRPAERRIQRWTSILPERAPVVGLNRCWSPCAGTGGICFDSCKGDGERKIHVDSFESPRNSEIPGRRERRPPARDPRPRPDLRSCGARARRPAARKSDERIECLLVARHKPRQQDRLAIATRGTGRVSTMCPIAHRSLARRIGRKKRGVSRPRARREGTPSPRAPRRAVGIRTSGLRLRVRSVS